MKLIKKITIGIFIFSSHFLFSQDIVQHSFNNHESIVIHNDKDKIIFANGINGILNYNSKTEIYKLEYIDSNGSVIYQIFKVVEKNNNDTIVEFVGDDSPIKFKYKVVNKIDKHGIIEFKSIDNTDLVNDVKFIFRYF